VIPEELADRVALGTMVRVSLAGRRVGAWVTEIDPPRSEVDPARLRPLARVTGHGPPAELIELAGWAAHRWAAGRLRPFLRAASPPRAVPVLPPPARAAAPGPGPALEPADPLARRLLADVAGGRPALGLLRRPPAEDAVPVVLAAAALGPTLVVLPSADEGRRLGVRLRRAGLSVAIMPRD